MRQRHCRRLAACVAASSTSTFRFPSSSSLLSPHRGKSYVVKFLRGQLPSDLKDVSGAIGCLYGSLPDVDEYAQFILNPTLVDSYHQLGYVKLPQPMLDPMQIDKLADEVDELANNVEHHPKTECLYATTLADLVGGPLFCCQGQWRASWGLHDLVYHPSITVPASQILGNSLVRLWYDEVYKKDARKGPWVPWLQNYTRWQHTSPMQHVTVLIALDSLNKDRGAPCVVPGSHRWRDGDLLPAVPFDPTQDESTQMNAIFDIINDDEKETIMDTPPVTIDMKRGEAMFIHPTALYSTHGNRSLDPCRYILVHFMGGKVQTVQAGPLLPHSTKFAAGVPIHGPYYPVVFDPAMTEDLMALPGGSVPQPQP